MTSAKTRTHKTEDAEQGTNGATMSDSQQAIAELKAALAAKESELTELKQKAPRKPRAERKAREPKAAAEPMTVEQVAAKQATAFRRSVLHHTASQVLARVKVGQDQGEAIQEVLSQHAAQVRELLAAHNEAGTGLEQSVDAFVAARAPRAPRGSKKAAASTAESNDEE